MMDRPLLVLFAVCAISSSVGSLAPHNWDCIACETNSMLAGNWDINNPNFNNTDLWWAKTIASSYAAVALNLNSANTSITVEHARILKRLNPKIKFLVYQNSVLGPLTNEASATINAHPEWWCRDDTGAPITLPQGYTLNHSRADVRSFYNNYPLHVFGADAKELLDGVLNDDMGYSPHSLAKTNLARHDQWYRGKMQMSEEGSAIYGALNGGEMWGNDALNFNSQFSNTAYNGSVVNWNTSLAYQDVGFVEGAGCFWYQNRTTGEWEPDRFNTFLEGVINASAAGKPVVLHFSPGPSNVPIFKYPQEPSPSYNTFLALQWEGPTGSAQNVNTTADAVRANAKKALVGALAPFLIVASELVFFQYSWFYELQDGNIPCQVGIECGMPNEWYAEYSKPLGAPTGRAVKNGYVWTREFAHASVYVDARSRSSAKITWH
jgi:hypothetical protein